MSDWLSQFPAAEQAVIRELCVPKHNPISRKERRAAERAERKRIQKRRQISVDTGTAPLTA